MERRTFIARILPKKLEEARLSYKNSIPGVAERALSTGASNLSFWRANEIVFGYYESVEGDATGLNLRELFDKTMSEHSILIASPGNMRLMYSAIGFPRKDKSLLKHRVFVTRLKPGCAEVYKSRHDVLAMRQGKQPVDGPVNNFTIWNAGDYICGYSEVDADFIPYSSEMSKKATAAWEMKMLEIMDWLTNDVDHISGQQNNEVECLYKEY